MAKKKPKKQEREPETIEQQVDRLYPAPNEPGWKTGDPMSHERVEWMKLRENRIAQAKESRVQAEIAGRKQANATKKRCAYERPNGQQCTAAVQEKTKWCELHAKECPECFERIRKDEKYCQLHACELCGDYRDIQGPNCARCTKELNRAMMGHVDLAPLPPDRQALADAEAAGIT